MRKSGFTAVLAAGMLLLAACGSEAKNIDAAALASSLVTDISYDDQLEQISDDDVSMYIDVPDGVKTVMYMGGGSTAEEVAVFEAPDKDTAATVKDNVQTYLDDQSDSFQDYIPEESKRIGNAVLEQKDQYVILCVSGDSDGAKEIIEKAFKQYGIQQFCIFTRIFTDRIILTLYLPGQRSERGTSCCQPDLLRLGRTGVCVDHAVLNGV